MTVQRRQERPFTCPSLFTTRYEIRCGGTQRSRRVEPEETSRRETSKEEYQFDSYSRRVQISARPVFELVIRESSKPLKVLLVIHPTCMTFSCLPIISKMIKKNRYQITRYQITFETCPYAGTTDDPHTKQESRLPKFCSLSYEGHSYMQEPIETHPAEIIGLFRAWFIKASTIIAVAAFALGEEMTIQVCGRNSAGLDRILKIPILSRYSSDPSIILISTRSKPSE